MSHHLIMLPPGRAGTSGKGFSLPKSDTYHFYSLFISLASQRVHQGKLERLPCTPEGEDNRLLVLMGTDYVGTPSQNLGTLEIEQ